MYTTSGFEGKADYIWGPNLTWEPNAEYVEASNKAWEERYRIMGIIDPDWGEKTLGEFMFDNFGITDEREMIQKVINIHEFMPDTESFLEPKPTISQRFLQSFTKVWDKITPTN